MSTHLPQPGSSRAAAPLHVLILGAGFTTDNRGVAALACGTLAAIYHSFPDANVAFLDYSRTPSESNFQYQGKRHSIGFVALRFSKNIFQRNHVVRLLLTALGLRLLPGALRSKWISRNPWLSRIAHADLIGALSGGDSFSDLYGMRRLLYVTLPQLLVLMLGKPLILLPQSYGPFRGFVARCLARFVLRRAHRIYSRDEQGIDAMRQLDPIVAQRTLFAFDMGFALEPRAPAISRLASFIYLKQRRPVVGLNVSGLLYFSHRDARNPFQLRSSYVDLLNAIIVQLVQEKECSVVLVPHVFGLNGESDATASLAFMSQLPASVASSVTLLEGTWDQHQVKYVIGECDLFIGARMHACIAALSQSVPTVALAYSDKFSGVLSSIGGRDFIVDLRTCDRKQALTTVGYAFDHRVVLEFGLAARTPSVRKKVLGFFQVPGLLNPGARAPVMNKMLRPDFDPA